jgi:molybdopterin molybdotransferase
MRPGSPLAAGRIGRTPWIGLPGNPVSTLVTFTLFAAPAIRRLGGATAVFPAPLRVRVSADVSISAPLTHYLRATLHPAADGNWEAQLTGAQASNIASSMARADALLVVDAQHAHIPAGAWCSAIELGPQGLLQEQP